MEDGWVDGWRMGGLIDGGWVVEKTDQRIKWTDE